MIKMSANLSTLFQHVPWVQRFAAARNAGFDGAEIQFPYNEPAVALARAATAADCPVVLINGPLSHPAHPYGIASRAELRSEFLGQLALIEEYALALGVRYVHILAGRIEPDYSRTYAMETYVENLSKAVARLSPHGVEILIEPLNSFDAPGYLLDSLDLAVDVIERCGSGIKLLFDVYHVSRMGLDPLSEFRGRLAVIRHVQFADFPGRHEPGTGKVPFDAFVSELLEVGYEGWLGAEYVPLAEPMDGSELSWLRAWRKVLAAG